MRLEEKIAAMCVIGVPSLEAGQPFRERLSRYPYGGIGLFPHNIQSERQLRQLVEEVEALAAGEQLPVPYYLSIDEEAGSLSNFKSFYPFIPGNGAVGVGDDPEAAFLLGKLIGSQLYELGIPMNWGPVLDVNTNIDNPVIGIRSFGSDAEKTAAFGQAYIRGLHEAGAAATAKHFPGHGQVSGDSHYMLPECTLTAEELRQGPLVPFAAAIEAGVDAIMTAHLVFPNIEEAGGLPASLNPWFVTKLLREEMQFNGVICTDDVEMKAIRDHYEPEEIGVLAVQAGNDMVLMCHTADFQDRVVAGIVAAVQDGRIRMEQIDESYERIRQLRCKFSVYRSDAVPFPKEKWKEEAKRLARRTVHVLADPQQLLPLDPSRRYLLLLPEQVRLTVADTSASSGISLAPLLQSYGITVDTLPCSIDPESSEIGQILVQCDSYDCILQGTINAHLFHGQLRLAEQLAAVKPLLHLVLRNPYDAEYLPPTSGKVLLCSTSHYSLLAFAEAAVTRK
ncbi:beta-glucosidase [Paenibacillus glycanilyticus]|uniref:beta-N-acetylhexosaminidase n=1 Tax=Paenibacillus glycanilyticus TaxID=126569 RepID=A0ABQ6GB44_9BACL|nr:beta-glucosidase [Paenibacillus glycanilyticus]